MFTQTLIATHRPSPSARGTSRWHTIPRSAPASGEPHLLLLVRGEEVDDAVDGLLRVGRVQRRQHEVTRLRGGERGLHGLRVAHLPDEDDVGVLAHRR
ncbi:MAG TPA: hypothetical protein VKP64_00420, partial [Mycobacteriales bacterium]|nr:hypothetical protein [Mycobacteriales bacterium]